ncbi:MAG TPA: hypothetical protein VGG62_08210 [Terracidiphilus sp.]
MKSNAIRVSRVVVDGILVLMFTVLGFLVMGYHPALEDDGVYLSAVKSDLDPALYPHDSDFFRLQLQATIFDRWMALFVRVTRIPVAWAELLWQFLSLYVILWSALRIAQKLFPERRSPWAGIALLGAMFTLPVAGTALNLADQHLHPRTMATALILVAIDRILQQERVLAVLLLLLALVVHPIMAVFGISFCFFLALSLNDRFYQSLGARLSRAMNSSNSLAGALPLAWIFEPPNPAWRRAVETRTYYFLYRWTWYEWLGALAPLLLFWLLFRYALKYRDDLLARFALALLLYGTFQQLAAMILLAPPAFMRISPLQPMRYLHLVYVFLALMAGCFLGRHVLGRRVGRWVLFLVFVNGGMFVSQRLMFPNSNHLEFPGRESANPWLQAFTWIRRNTPKDAYFALDPNYLALPGEDYHSFRALAERSQLADAIKDTAVVTQVPKLGPAWARQVDAQAGWDHFQFADFARLREQFGVDWALVSYPPPARLTCIWHNDLLSACRVNNSSPGQSF